MFWNTLMGFNSFIVIPATALFVMYTGGRAVLLGEWRTFIIAIFLFFFSLVAEVVLAIMDDG